MKATLDINKLEHLPLNLRKLLPKPEQNRVSFNELSDSNIERAANYVKTKTLIDLLETPPLNHRIPQKGDNPIILVFCQPSEGIYIQKNGDVYPFAPISYPNWLEGVGAHCIPLPYNIN